MLVDGLKLVEGSVIVNATVASGASFPSSPNAGEMFFRTDLNALHIHTGSSWVAVGSGGASINFASFAHSIIPATDITYDLGSPTKMWKDIYVGPGSIYMNGQKILENVSDTIIFTADADQNMRIATKGTGNLEFGAADGVLLFKGTMQIQSGKKIIDTAGHKVEFGDNIDMGTANKVVNLGTPTAAGDATTKAYVDGLTTSDTTIVRTNITNPVIAGTSPTISTHLTTKSYVDTLVQGLSWKQAARLATTGNITLSGYQDIDGQSLNDGDRILVKAQSTAAQNGVYVVASGAWARASDFDGSPSVNEINGAAIYVTDGTVNGDTTWTQTATVTTVGSQAMQFAQLSSSSVVNANVLSGTILAANVVSSSLTSVGTITSGTWNATLGAVSGASLTNLNAANLTGTVATARMGSGTANSGSFLRGDGSWANAGSSAIDFASNYVETKVAVTATTTTTLNCSAGNVFDITLGTNVTTFGMSNIPSTGKVYTMTLFITNSGTFTFAWPGSVRWAGGTAPVVTAAAGKTDIFTLVTHNGGSTWYGFIGGQNF